VDKERDRKLDSDEEDLMNGGVDDEESTQVGSQPKNTRSTMKQGGTLIFTRN